MVPLGNNILQAIMIIAVMATSGAVKAQEVDPWRILVWRANAAEFADTTQGLETALGAGYRVFDQIYNVVMAPENQVSGFASTRALSGAMNAGVYNQVLDDIRPHLIVLLDTPIWALHREVAATRSMPPVVALGFDLAHEAAKLPDAELFSWEPPISMGLKALSNMGSLPTGKTGVIAMADRAEYINREAAFAEGHELVIHQFECPPSAREMLGAMKKLIRRYKVSALWFPSDSRMHPAFEASWRSWASRPSRTPLVTDTPGMFGDTSLDVLVTRNMTHVGYQMAEVIETIAGAGWQVKPGRVHEPDTLIFQMSYRFMRATRLTAEQLDSQGMEPGMGFVMPDTRNASGN